METYSPLLRGPQPVASHLREQKNARYRALADYEKTAQTYLLLEDVNWQPVRELILHYWQQAEAEVRRAFFIRHNGPEFLAARYDKRRGAYPSRLIYLPHEFHPLWGWCPLALDRTGRVPVGTMSRRQKPEQRLATEEREGYEYLARKQQAHPDARAQVAGDLLRVAQVIRHNPALNILLELGTPRLSQLSSGAGNALGYATYFLECWQRFHEYENPSPAHAAGAKLAQPSLDYMPRQPATPPAGPLPVLPGTIAGRLAYFDELLATCRRAKHPHDTAEILREAYEQNKSRGLYELADFMERLPLYVVKELPSELRSHVESNVLAKLRGEFRLFRLKPETWPVWAVSQRGEIIARQQDVTERLSLAESDARPESEQRAVASWHARHGEKAASDIADSQKRKRIADVAAHQKTLARLGKILAALDTAAAAGVAVVSASELAPPRPASSPAPHSASLTLPHETPAPNPFAKLLLNYTLAELTALLGELGLLDKETGQASPAASPGAWVGVIYALLEAERPRLAGSKAAARRGFVKSFGAVVSESAVHTGLGKRGSEAETFKNRALDILNR